jgi:hypothetical protein
VVIYPDTNTSTSQPSFQAREAVGLIVASDMQSEVVMRVPET